MLALKLNNLSKSGTWSLFHGFELLTNVLCFVKVMSAITCDLDSNRFDVCFYVLCWVTLMMIRGPLQNKYVTFQILEVPILILRDRNIVFSLLTHRVLVRRHLYTEMALRLINNGVLCVYYRHPIGTRLDICVHIEIYLRYLALRIS